MSGFLDQLGDVSDREGVDDSRPCGCTQDCDCLGPNPPPAANAFVGLWSEVNHAARPLQERKAFAALSSMPSAPWMRIGDLVQRLRRFGHSDQWAADMAREWMKEHSKLVGR